MGFVLDKLFPRSRGAGKLVNLAIQYQQSLRVRQMSQDFDAIPRIRVKIANLCLEALRLDAKASAAFVLLADALSIEGKRLQSEGKIEGAIRLLRYAAGVINARKERGIGMRGSLLENAYKIDAQTFEWLAECAPGAELSVEELRAEYDELVAPSFKVPRLVSTFRIEGRRGDLSFPLSSEEEGEKRKDFVDRLLEDPKRRENWEQMSDEQRERMTNYAVFGVSARTEEII